MLMGRATHELILSSPREFPTVRRDRVRLCKSQLSTDHSGIIILVTLSVHKVSSPAKVAGNVFTKIMMPEWSVESWDLHNLTLSRRTVGNSLGELRINS